MNFKEKVVIVTGASRGIGAEILEAFLEKGAFVFGIYKSDDDAVNLLKEKLIKFQGKFRFNRGDISKKTMWKSLCDEAVKNHGKIDVLVNNAGISADGLFLNFSYEKNWNPVLQTNLFGTFVACREVVQAMLLSNGGKIVNIGSSTSIFGMPAASNYAASKGGIAGITHLLAREYAKNGIYINTLSPGFTDTSLIKAVPKEVIDGTLKKTILKRMSKPADIAGAVLFLASPYSDYINGSIVRIDGGMYQ
jgi:3-oxoacyl-[acyl-carrier protein] reductase